jgi:hypothetical protein
MPCPPSWEELEALRLDRETSAVLPTLLRDLSALIPTLALARHLAPRAAEADVDLAEFERTLHEADTITARGATAPVLPGAPETPGFATEAALEHWGRELALQQDVARRAELCLCVLRTFLARCRRRGLTRDLDAAQTAALDATLDAHRAHRVAERDAAVRAARADLEFYRKDPVRAYTVGLLTERIARLEALDEETLVCDRGSTR